MTPGAGHIPTHSKVRLLRSGSSGRLRQRADGDEQHTGPSATFDRGPTAGRPAMAGRGRVEADPRAVSPSRPRSHRPLRCRRARLRGAALGHVKRSRRSRPRRRHAGGVRAVRRERNARGGRPPREPLVGRVGALALDTTYVLAADDLYAVQSQRVGGVGPDSITYQSEFAYDRHEGIPVLLGAHLGGLARREARDERLEGRRPPLWADPRGRIRPRSVPRRPPESRPRSSTPPTNPRCSRDGSGYPSRSVRSAWSAARCCHSGQGKFMTATTRCEPEIDPSTSSLRSDSRR